MSGLRSRWEALSPNMRGIAWMMLASICYPSMATLIKMVSLEGYHSLQITFFRCAFGLLSILPFIAGDMREALKTTRPGLHLCNAVNVLGAIFFSVFAFIALPLAQAVAITFTKPLWMTVLAVPFFGEKLGWRRTGALLAGFGGVMLITRPGFVTLELGAIAALIAALGFAGQSLFGKKLAATDSGATIVFYSVVGATVLSLFPALTVWKPVTAEVFMLGVAIGILGTLAQITTIRAVRVGEAGAVAPFDYFRLLYAGIYGYLIFGEAPDAWTWAGAGVIVVSTLYIAQRERTRTVGT